MKPVPETILAGANEKAGHARHRESLIAASVLLAITV
jgi:hypothetical protein